MLFFLGIDYNMKCFYNIELNDGFLKFMESKIIFRVFFFLKFEWVVKFWGYVVCRFLLFGVRYNI